ncbi:hypothetical protein PTTW11_05125 [Pyrenophora teres f. teres]|uniref:Uncharacterized protein n=1 Tax=Pyrenophora teres f. teres TaxID=97479 RepID=A0A6S6W145_9PLEO|nr:hypothetical protein PTTW11_05125 [Pyrenophora teres f. teres]
MENMDQHQSPLFRLPRELRDEIYGYYLHEDGGYITSQSAQRIQRLQRQDGRSIELGLSYACKRVATEIEGLALKKNAIRFSVLPAKHESVSRYSTAGLFDYLLERRAGFCRVMLSHAYWLVSPEAMQAVRTRHPGNTAVEKLEKTIIRDGNYYLNQGHLHHFKMLDYVVGDVILHDLIQIIAENTDFELLTSKEYDPDVDVGPLYVDPDANWDWRSEYSDIDDIGSISSDSDDGTTRSAFYSKETRDRVVEWRPAFWCMPQQQDLAEVAKFLPTSLQDLTHDDEGHELRLKQYFSAAAAAIHFLEHLGPKQRMHVRKIVIQEDHTSVGLPQTHARGLIPFCIENPDLRIERRIDIWRTDFIPKSEHFSADIPYIVSDVAKWISEARLLRIMGMPSTSFSLVLHGPTEEASQQLCDAMIKAAIWHEGAQEVARRTGSKWEDYYGIAEDFFDVIKAMVRGDIPARFEADMGEVWDIEEILRDSEGDEPASAREVFALENFEEPVGGWEAARAKYMEQTDWVDLEKSGRGLMEGLMATMNYLDGTDVW